MGTVADTTGSWRRRLLVVEVVRPVPTVFPVAAAPREHRLHRHAEMPGEPQRISAYVASLGSWITGPATPSASLPIITTPIVRLP